MEFALINAIPFALAALIAVPGLPRLMPRSLLTWGTAIVMGGLFAALLGYLPAVTVAAETKDALTFSLPWVPSLGLSLSYYIDGLSLLFALVVTGVGALILIYAGYYFDDADEHFRFTWQMLAFAGAMLGVVMSGNFIMTFIMWELTSITSFLLISFKGAKYESARFAGFQALFVTGIGALAMIVGLVIMGIAAGQITDAGMILDVKTLLKVEGLAEHPYYLAFTILIMLGAFTKSAQFPFHFWLPGAMDAPTPASAYLHSATMVKAGIFLLARLYPPLHEGPEWTTILVLVGLATFFIGAFYAILQKDLKGILAYSTVSWLGALVAMIGLPEYAGIKALMIGILAHAFYKAALFLAVGTIDHSLGTRLIDRLGGLRKQMPILAVIVVISTLSMAGVPFLFGFVAKEVLLDAFMKTGEVFSVGTIFISAVLTGVVGFMVAWDVFFRPAPEELHFHKPSPLIHLAPGVLAVGSLLLGFLIDPVIVPLIEPAVPKAFELYLFPGFTDVFMTSIAVLVVALVIFFFRRAWIGIPWPPMPSAVDLFRRSLALIDSAGDQVLRSQSGQVRYYLVVILGAVAALVIGSGLLIDLTQGQDILSHVGELTSEDFLAAMLIVLAIGAALLSVVLKQHLAAVLALGIVGYAVAGVFMLAPAPDVALVQIIVETLATLVLVLMIGRISVTQRKAIMDKLWSSTTSASIWRDALVAGVAGLTVFIFALNAVVNRPERDSIANWHLENTYGLLGVTDIVGAIVADFRGMDTFLEIGVFAVAALGVVTLLGRGLRSQNPFVPEDAKTQGELESGVLEQIQDATQLSTPFTRMVSTMVLIGGFLIAATHLIFGSGAPGDGFTAGAISGLVVALSFVVFGYHDTKERLRWFHPHRELRIGLALALVNAILPMFMDGGAFLAYVPYDKLFGIDVFLSPAGLKLTSTLLFEIGIALTVFGGVGVIMEAVAHPKEPDQALT